MYPQARLEALMSTIEKVRAAEKNVQRILEAHED
jgi:hypothetical protein